MGKQWKTAGKEAQAGKKGALFTKLSREIQVSARLAGPNPENNSRLKLALETARSHSLPKDTIERAINKGILKSEDQIEEVIYEGFGPHNVAVIVLCLTDNRVRTVSEIRYLFKKHKGNMAESGSVMWMFDKVALVLARRAENYIIDLNSENQPEAMSVEEEAILAGADDIRQAGDYYTFYGKWEELSALRENLIKRKWEIKKAEQAYKSKTKISLNEEQTLDVLALLKLFEENPDCKAVYTNRE